MSDRENIRKSLNKETEQKRERGERYIKIKRKKNKEIGKE